MKIRRQGIDIIYKILHLGSYRMILMVADVEKSFQIHILDRTAIDQSVFYFFCNTSLGNEPKAQISGNRIDDGGSTIAFPFDFIRNVVGAHQLLKDGTGSTAFFS